MTYAEQLKSPKWQRRRLELLQRSNWRCQSCGDTETELHVHHLSYEAPNAAWQYPDENFQVLCSTCHDLTHVDRDKLLKFCNFHSIGLKPGRTPTITRLKDMNRIVARLVRTEDMSEYKELLRWIAEAVREIRNRKGEFEHRLMSRDMEEKNGR